MPELPEIETIRRVLEPQLAGQRIREMDIRRPEVIAYPSAGEFRRGAEGQAFTHLERRGKFLTACLKNGSCMRIHLRMTGCLLLTPEGWPEEKHTHLVFRLEDGRELRFSDVRRFGRFWLFRKGEADSCSGVEKLGEEPFADGFSAAYLRERLGKRRKTVKDCLLEQSVVAGIGNIYSDEILFAARIYPARPADSLTAAEWERLASAIPERLHYFIDRNAVTPEEYLAGKGQDYRNTPYLQVYGHAGEPCPDCQTRLCRTVIGGRSSVYCPVCQRAEK